MLADFVFTSKYAKYLENSNRRETYTEAIDRMMDMHTRKFQGSNVGGDVLEDLRTLLKDKRIIGSQRALQFGGGAIEEKNWRIFNCVTSYCDRLDFFAESLWLLLAGCGTGFSICKSHVNKLPTIQKSSDTFVYTIADSIEGWADSVKVLLGGYSNSNPVPFFDFSEIRPKGAKLRHGGKAPGHEGLEFALKKIRAILENANGRKMKPIECFDIVMHLSDCVLAGGIRRSSAIALFDADDEEMIKAKTGNWWSENPQRGRANISAVILPNTPKAVYEHIFEQAKAWGEPGFLFLAHEDYVLNPCSEASMCPQLITDPNGNVVKEYTLDMLTNKEHYKQIGYTFESGWQACNLTSINGAKVKTAEDFYEATVYATILGTLQTTYSKTTYLNPVSQRILERENLLGVSITGMMMNQGVLLNPEIQRKAAELAVKTNQEFSQLLGINPSSRITLVKPEGTASLVLEATSGIHPAHAPRYIRHVQCTDIDAPYLHFKQTNPQACFDSAYNNPTQKVIAFPMEFNDAIYSHEVSATQLLEYSKITQQNWVSVGTALPKSCESLKHNVSITVSIKPEEWSEVSEYLWTNKEFFTGVAMLPSSGDYTYKQAPFVRVYSPEEIEDGDAHKEAKLFYWKLWNELRQSLQAVDYTLMLEYSDDTNFAQEAACAGGQCAVSI